MGVSGERRERGEVLYLEMESEGRMDRIGPCVLLPTHQDSIYVPLPHIPHSPPCNYHQCLLQLLLIVSQCGS